jgi:hypothetical protein
MREDRFKAISKPIKLFQFTVLLSYCVRYKLKLFLGLCRQRNNYDPAIMSSFRNSIAPGHMSALHLYHSDVILFKSSKKRGQSPLKIKQLQDV